AIPRGAGRRGRAGPRRVRPGFPHRDRGAARGDPDRARRRGTGTPQGPARRAAALFRADEVPHGVRLLHLGGGGLRRASLRGDPGLIRRVHRAGPLARGPWGLLMAAPSFDAIVVGSGITGGWAAKELCERGLKTLVLEAGRPIDPARDYVEHVPPWAMKFRGFGDRKALERDQFIQRHCYACNEYSGKFFVNDRENPYSFDADKPFHWIRGRQVGGRSIMWGRQVYRWSDLDFEANARDGFGVDWPIRYADIAPWYDHVEEFIGISGEALGLPQLPDGKFLPPMALNCAEQVVRAGVVFLCASTLESTRILLNSKTPRFPTGLANSSGALGKNLMDHIMGGGAGGTIPGMEDHAVHGHRPNGIYVPRFRNVKASHPDLLRGYGFQGGADRAGWGRMASQPGFGVELKKGLHTPGPWHFSFYGFGECLPRPTNYVELDSEKVDAWGI